MRFAGPGGTDASGPNSRCAIEHSVLPSSSGGPVTLGGFTSGGLRPGEVICPVTTALGR